MRNFLLPVMAILISVTGCKKKDVVKTFPEENPLSAYLSAAGFTQVTTNFVNAGSYEFGIKFTPLVKGKINAIKFKIPDAATNIRVTIWDATAKTILRTETIPSATLNTETSLSISPLMLDKDKMYMITYNGNDWYKRSKTDGTVTTYPITAGHISINGYSWIGGANQTFPTTVSNDYYAGDLSFVFQQTE